MFEKMLDGELPSVIFRVIDGDQTIGNVQLGEIFSAEFSDMKTTMSVMWDSDAKRHEITSAVAGAKEIAAWLSDDLPRGKASIDAWLKQLADVAAGKIEGGYLGTGNAHHVRAMGDLVFLECEFVEEMKVLLTYKQVVEVLEKYSDFLDAEVGNIEFPPPPFDVEYEAVGDAALDLYLENGGKLGM